MGLFRKNKLDLKIERYNYKPGEIVKGSFYIDLKKTYEVRKIQVSLIGRRKERYTDAEGETQYHFVNVYEFPLPIAPEGKYQYQQFHFEIKIPDTILEQCDQPIDYNPDTTLGKIAEFSRAMSTNRTYPVEWLIEAQLDIPMRIDMTKSHKIIISL